ncbi:MAG TPA: DUF47 family protein [Thermoplasmata archaeon]|nr:DUF47 family protein [Thermoplasmata archaeon]
MGLREWIVPQEHIFFDLFEKEIALSVKGARMLREGVKEMQDTQKTARDLKVLENESDSVVHEIYVKLNSTFITPLDQGDIGKFASTVDDILDHVEAAATRIYLYKIKERDRFFIGFSEALVVQTKELEEAIQKMRDRSKFHDIQKHLIEVHKQENVADDIQREALATVFDFPDPKVIMKLKECYDMLELATDKCETAATLIEDIVVRYS